MAGDDKANLDALHTRLKAAFRNITETALRKRLEDDRIPLNRWPWRLRGDQSPNRLERAKGLDHRASPRGVKNTRDDSMSLAEFMGMDGATEQDAVAALLAGHRGAQQRHQREIGTQPRRESAAMASLLAADNRTTAVSPDGLLAWFKEKNLIEPCNRNGLARDAIRLAAKNFGLHRNMVTRIRKRARKNG